MGEVSFGLEVMAQAGGLVLAQAGDSTNIAGIVLLIAVIAIIALLSYQSRQQDAPPTPRADLPEAERRPTRQEDLVKDRDDVDAERVAYLRERVEADEATLAETKEWNLLPQDVRKEARRTTAVEQTETAKSELRRADDDDEGEGEGEVPEAADEDEVAGGVDASEEPAEPTELAPERGDEASVPAQDLGALDEPVGFDDESWADLDVDIAEGSTDLDLSEGDVAEVAGAVEEPKQEEPKHVDPMDASVPAKSVADGLQKSREEERGFGRLRRFFRSKAEIDSLVREEIEEFLYTSDIGVSAAQRIFKVVEEQLDSEEASDPQVVWDAVRGQVLEMLEAREVPLDVEAHTPYVILVIGVNGAGKTTTIGKLATRFRRHGKEVMVVAGDTFRAAAVEQLEVWAERSEIPIHKGAFEADPASVVFDGIKRGVEEGVDVVICDTAGRLQTNKNLMSELAKIARVSGKALDDAPHETILVLDANTGQYAVQQAKKFGADLDITGLVLTKLDGTARGGVILAIGEELDIPVRFIGIGEGVNDLRTFDAS
ncbi:MAG: signal recognition particle-docking protein FtsY, partial [Myxococcota bacterium]